MAGTFLKQIPKKVEVVSGGVAAIQSVASVRVKEIDSEVKFNEDNEFAKWFEPAPVSVSRKQLNERVITAQIQSVQAIDSLSYVTAKTQRKTDIGARKVIGLFSSLQADRTIIRGELQRQDIFFPAPVVTQTVVWLPLIRQSQQRLLYSTYSLNLSLSNHTLRLRNSIVLHGKRLLSSKILRRKQLFPTLRSPRSTLRQLSDLLYLLLHKLVSLVKQSVLLLKSRSLLLNLLLGMKLLSREILRRKQFRLLTGRSLKQSLRRKLDLLLSPPIQHILTRTEAITTRPSETFVSD